MEFLFWAAGALALAATVWQVATLLTRRPEEPACPHDGLPDGWMWLTDAILLSPSKDIAAVIFDGPEAGRVSIIGRSPTGWAYAGTFDRDVARAEVERLARGAWKGRRR